MRKALTKSLIFLISFVAVWVAYDYLSYTDTPSLCFLPQTTLELPCDYTDEQVQQALIDNGYSHLCYKSACKN